MQRVFVLAKNRNPLMPCHPARARELLNKGKAKVLRRSPFTIILVEREGGAIQPVTFKVDPGSKTTGMALVAAFERGQRVIWAGELSHRGEQIRARLLARRQLRRSRRSRKTRYRPARFLNRCTREGWLPPSLDSRVANTLTWAARMLRLSPVCALSLETARFDTQLMQNPELSGVAYQQGELQGYEVREYLLEKWGRRCAYCGVSEVPLEVEHIVPKVRGGTNRVSNLTLACSACNRDKGSQTAAEYGHPDIQSRAKLPLKDAAAVNATRWAVWRRLAALGLPLEQATGGRTKFNRVQQGYPKAHWIDAACVGVSGDKVFIQSGHAPLLIQATGHQSRQMCRVDKYGFPRTSAKRGRVQFGFQTGDRVRAVVPSGKKQGTYVGRVAVRSSGSFNITTQSETVQGIPHRCCTILQQSDGYIYGKGAGWKQPA